MDPRPAKRQRLHGGPWKLGDRVQARWRGTWFSATVVQPPEGVTIGPRQRCVHFDMDNTCEPVSTSDIIPELAEAAGSHGGEAEEPPSIGPLPPAAALAPSAAAPRTPIAHPDLFTPSPFAAHCAPFPSAALPHQRQEPGREGRASAEADSACSATGSVRRCGGTRRTTRAGYSATAAGSRPHRVTREGRAGWRVLRANYRPGVQGGQSDQGGQGDLLTV